MNVLNESTRGARRSWRRRAMVGCGLTATAVLAIACVPDVTTPPSATTTTTTTTSTTAPVSWTPQVTVSTTSNLEAGDTITVTGSGFDPNANIGTRPPLSGQKSGVYLTFGRYADVWQPSAGAPAAARTTISQVWALPQSSYDALGGIPGTVVLGADGTFTATLAISTDSSNTDAYGVVTYGGGGSVNASQETMTRVTFAPKVTATKTADLIDGESVTVSGIGFLPSANGTRPPLSGQPSGVYVTFGKFADVWQPSLGSAVAPSSTRTVINQLWALPQAQYTAQGAVLPYIPINADGSFSGSVPVAVSAAGTNPNYGFAVYPASGAVNAGQEFFLPTTWAPVTT